VRAHAQRRICPPGRHPDGASCARRVEIPLQSSVSDQIPMLRSMLVVGYSGDYPLQFAPLGSGLLECQPRRNLANHLGIRLQAHHSRADEFEISGRSKALHPSRACVDPGTTYFNVWLTFCRPVLRVSRPQHGHAALQVALYKSRGGGPPSTPARIGKGDGRRHQREALS
jgi:hypothetical protein